MKKLFFTIFIGFPFLFIVSCKNDRVSIGGNLSTDLPGTSTSVTVPASTYIYGNSFRVDSSSIYEKLMEYCRRCGLKRSTTFPWGGTSYQRHYTWDDSDPKRCQNWNSQGYIEIKFAENKLPTTATVYIWPKYTGQRPLIDPWYNNNPFAIQATALPINENKGFQIILRPTDGLGGTHNMDIRSNYSNHIRQSNLDITVTYGPDNQVIISETLKKLPKTRIDRSPVDCSTYTN